MKKYISILLAAVLVLSPACPPAALPINRQMPIIPEKLSVVTTIFPQYDFTRQIVGDKADVTMLLKPGAESHSYEPTRRILRRFRTAICSSTPEARMMYGWTIF